MIGCLSLHVVAFIDLRFVLHKFSIGHFYNNITSKYTFVTI